MHSWVIHATPPHRPNCSTHVNAQHIHCPVQSFKKKGKEKTRTHDHPLPSSHYSPYFGKLRCPLCGISRASFPSVPIRDRVGRFKAPIRCLRGAISSQSKANELPQSTRQVLINIHAFAFKSRPIYRSFPSICETWKIHAELLFEGGLHGEEYYGGYYGGRRVGVGG